MTLVQVRTDGHTTYAVATEQRDRVLAMSAHPGHHVIDDRTAATIASWYHSPGECCRHITSLSHGMPFDTEALLAEIHDEIEPIDTRDAAALRRWVQDQEPYHCDCGPFGHRSDCRNVR